MVLSLIMDGNLLLQRSRILVAARVKEDWFSLALISIGTVPDRIKGLLHSDCILIQHALRAGPLFVGKLALETLPLPEQRRSDLSVTWADISVTDVVGYGKSANLPNSGGANLKWVFMSGSGSDENLDTLKTGQHGLSLTFEGDFTSVSDLEGKNKTYNYTGTIVNVVPEPSTVIAGMVLLLPFGASTVRLLRKGRASR